MKKVGKALGITLLFLLVIPVLLIVAPFLIVALWTRGRWLRHRFCRKWGSQGKPILFVYSDSPNWKEYIEENWLPRLQPHAVVLNWSERSQWKRTAPFESKVFRHFAGREEFNPIAIYFPPRGSVREVRFWQPFKDFKHGKDRLLRAAESQLFDVVAEVEGAAA